MQDKMTPNERKQALRGGKPVDRLPITLSHEGFSAKLSGMNYREAFNTPEKAARKEINFYRKYGMDGISVSYTSVNYGIRHRSKIKSPKYMPASIDEHVLSSLDEVDRLDPEMTSFKRDISQQVNYEALQIMQEEVGDEISPTYCISAPFTLASGVLAPEKILRGTRKSPEKVHELMRFTTDCLKRMIDQLSGLTFLSYFIYDPVASGSLISPKQYREFSLPYTKEVVSHMKKDQPDRWVGMHICGNTTKSLAAIADTGIDGFSLDQKVDLADAKEAIGSRVALLGNVDPITVFLQGDAKKMDEAVRNCYEKAGDSPGGFILRSGCGVPYETTVEQVDAYVKAAKHYGQWPLDLEKLTS